MGGRYLGIGAMRGDKKTVEVYWGMWVWFCSQQTEYHNVVERFMNGQVAGFCGRLTKVDKYGANCLGHSVRVRLEGIVRFGSPETVRPS